MSGTFSADVTGLEMGSEQCQDISKDTEVLIFLVQGLKLKAQKILAQEGDIDFHCFFLGLY